MKQVTSPSPAARFRRVVLAGAVLLGGIGLERDPAQAADAPAAWPQWRGPLATGAAPEGANPPAEWSEQKNVKWKVQLPGRGESTPIVVGDRIFVQTAVQAPAGQQPAAAAEEAEPLVTLVQAPPDRPRRRRPGGGGGGGFGGMNVDRPTTPYRFVLLCLDRQTGKTVWEKVAKEETPHEGHHKDHGFSSHSPVSDGQHVYAYFGSRGLHCFDLEGNLKWSKELGKMQTRNGFGEGSSPALHGDVIVVLWDHEGEDDFVVALDKSTGKELWRKPRAEATTWTTPLVVEHGGKAQVIVSATNAIRSYDLKTGDELWRCGGMTTNVIPTPVADADHVYVTSGFRGAALLAIKLGRTGDLTGTDAIAWKVDKGTPYVPSPLLYNGRLYLFSGNSGILSCYDAKTGKPLLDTQRMDDLPGVYASPVGAGGRVYLVGRNGATTVLQDGEQPKELGTSTLDDQFHASPAVAGNELFLRGFRSLYCIAEK